MYVRLFLGLLAAVAGLSLYEIAVVIAGRWDLTITAIVTASDAGTVLAVVAVAASALGLIAHFVYERVKRRSERW